MNLTINKDNLITALLKLEDVINGNDSSSIQSNILIQTRGDRIELTATDLEITIQTTTYCSVIEDGKVAVSGKHMTDIIDNLPSKTQIDISSSSESDVLEISCTEGRYKLRTVPVSYFSVLPTLHGSILSIEDQSLHSLIHKTAFVVDEKAVSKSIFSNPINGLFFNIHKDTTEIVATNGWVALSLARFNLKKHSNESNSFPFILPLKSAQNIIRHISDTSELSICFEANKGKNQKNNSLSYMQVNDGSTKITSKVLGGGSYPEYQAILTQDIIGGIKINRTRLIKGLERVSVLSNPELNRVKLSIQPDKLILSSETDNLGEALEEIDIEHIENENTIDVYLNAKHLIDGLLHMNDDEVTMEYSTDRMPVFFKSIPEENHIFVMCPMKLVD